jgi:hypothetical protein
MFRHHLLRLYHKLHRYHRILLRSQSRADHGKMFHPCSLAFYEISGISLRNGLLALCVPSLS